MTGEGCRRRRHPCSLEKVAMDAPEPDRGPPADSGTESTEVLRSEQLEAELAALEAMLPPRRPPTPAGGEALDLGVSNPPPRQP